MNWTDIGISLGLILLVLRQIRARQLSIASLLWPLGLVLWAAFDYLGAIPGDMSDIVFTTVLAGVGLALGLGCALLTSVYTEDGTVFVRARPAAAALWLIGMCSRLVFGIVALHGGAEAIGRLSERLDLHSVDTWAIALITMALSEVLSRTLVLGCRHRRATHFTADRAAPVQPTPVTVRADAPSAPVAAAATETHHPSTASDVRSALQAGRN